MTEFVPEVGGAGLSQSNLPRQLLDELFMKALRGEIPRSRALRSWEPETLNETHLQIILLRAAGMRQTMIAKYLNAQMGTKLSDATVSICCNHPDAVYILSKLVSYAADNVADIRTRMEAYASEALETNVRIMRTSNDERLKARVGFDLLDRAGYGAPRQVNVGVSGAVEHTISVQMAPEAANNLAAALRETQSLEIPADFVLNGQELLLGEGSGKALDGSESLQDSGPAAADVPPVRTSPVPLPKLSRREDADDEADFRALRNLRKVG